MPQLQSLILPVALLGLMYFLMIRPQQQQTKKRKEMLDALAIGAAVTTVGGMHGTVSALDENVVRLKVASGVELTFDRSSVRTIRESK